MNTLEALKEARRLVEGGWTQRFAARNAAGESCWVDSPLAVAYCATGAASAATWDDPVADEATLFSAVIEALTGALSDLWEVEIKEYDPPWNSIEALTRWNDSPGRSKNEVLRLYDRAIELVEA